MPIRTDPTARTGPTARPVAAPPVPGPVRSSEHAPRPAPRRPNPTSARLAVAAGGIATVSALLAAIGSAAVPAATVAGGTTALPTTPAAVQTIVRYVYVQPGQATPAAGVATVVATPAPRAVPAPVVTRQSGAKP